MMDFKPSVASFSLPLLPSQQPASVRVDRYESRGRRKHPQDWNKHDVEEETSDAASDYAATPSGPNLILSPEEAHQYRIAGLSFDRELPSGKFPHAAPQRWTRSARQTQKHVIDKLPSLSPPLYPPQSAAYQGNLRFQHLATLTAILHRCLLQGDYIRAGRAWGLLLREEFGGRSIEIRSEGRWGIGAEILLRRGCQTAAAGSASENGKLENRYRDATDNHRLWFTRAGFEDAKRYYEQLIIQYPFRKLAPNAICSLHFYPAMFGLWVYVVQEEFKALREGIQKLSNESAAWPSEEETSSDLEGRRGESQRRRDLLAGANDKEREQAQQIAAKMDEILTSPPYSDSPELLELRAMVSLWIADLFVSSPQEEPDDYDVDFDDNGFMMKEDVSESTLANREQSLAADKREVELRRSREFFEKATRRGRSVARTLEYLQIDGSNSPP